MAKVGIMTFLHNENCGSGLQAWALQEALRELGWEPLGLDYRPDRAEQLRNLLSSGNSPAVVLDSMANVAIEQVCDKAERLITAELPDCYLTYRYSPGYGDYPVTMQQRFLEILDAPRKIGLSRNESYLLTPAKSVTAIIGASKQPVERRRRGCAVCNLRETCRYRRRGNHCGFEDASQ